MRRPDQLALTDAATGRVSMPFLPTVAVVAVLGLASLYCPSSQPPSPEARAELTAPAAPSATAFARPMPVSSPIRRPASLAFAEIYPAGTPSVAPPARPVLAGRTNAHIAVAGRHPCPGRRCPEVPQRGTDPLAAGRAEAAESEEAGLLPPAALPFAASVVETLAPAARAVGDAAGLVRDGAAAVQGSVALVVADCLR